MKPYSPILFVELNNSELMFVIGKNEKENYFKILYKDAISIQSIYNSKIIDQSLILDLLKKNILIIEQKINYNFKEAILIIKLTSSSPCEIDKKWLW